MNYIDYYKALGVSRDASQDDLAKAYKRLARKYHPDLNKASNAEAKFKELNEAYEVLKDPEKRSRFDTLGANWKHGVPFEPPPGWASGGPGGMRYEFRNGGFGGNGFSDFFESLFGGGGGGGTSGAGFGLDDLVGGMSGRGRRGRGQDVESEVQVELEDAYRGNKRAVELSGPTGRRRYDVRIPKGIKDGERMRLANQGLPGPHGQRGDLYLVIRLTPHPQFRREGDDLIARVEVPCWDAALGAKVRVPTLEGDVDMALPAGLESGQRLRLRAKGMPKPGGGHGDLYAELNITIPTKLTAKQRRLFEELREVS